MEGKAAFSSRKLAHSGLSPSLEPARALALGPPNDKFMVGLVCLLQTSIHPMSHCKQP